MKVSNGPIGSGRLYGEHSQKKSSFMETRSRECVQKREVVSDDECVDGCHLVGRSADKGLSEHESEEAALVTPSKGGKGKHVVATSEDGGRSNRRGRV